VLFFSRLSKLDFIQSGKCINKRGGFPMSEAREAVTTVQLIDQYSSPYQVLFADVRSREHFKFLHLGLISELSRQSLPQLGRRALERAGFAATPLSPALSSLERSRPYAVH
jgi:hypothetical protein